MAATNRPDVLDPALLRPGRFDRHVVVPLPDIKGREGILRVHTRQTPLSDDVDIALLARGTSGFSGTQQANMANEAALNAARRTRKAVTMADFEEARDKSLMGRERKSLVISEKEKRSAAYHEAGHALVSYMLPEADPLHKVTIVPRGRALGATAQLPEENVYNHIKEYSETLVATLLAGRCAEEMFLDHLTTGASDDLRRVTELARKMVCEWGMSEELVPLSFGQAEMPVFVGREVARHQGKRPRWISLRRGSGRRSSLGSTEYLGGGLSSGTLTRWSGKSTPRIPPRSRLSVCPLFRFPSLSPPH